MQIRTKQRTGLLVAAVALLVCAMGIYVRVVNMGPTANVGGHTSEEIWQGVSCRVRIYFQKAEGAIPELSWRDLAAMTWLRPGFYCVPGRSLAGDLQYSSAASQADRSAGEHIFHQRCAACHGMDGSGGAFAPSLIGSRLTAGDSDLAIYQVLRNGRPGTAMQRVDLPPRELLEIIAYVTTLGARSAAAAKSGVPRLSIDVSGERLLAAGTKTDEWLTYSGSYDGSRHTTLDQITPANVANLRIRWIKQFDIAASNIEATPLVINGVIFFVPEAMHVVALDARTGNVIWEYKRPVPPDLPLGYGPVNRGLAVYGNTLFLGGLDGHLVALNADDGAVLWQTLAASPSDGFTITMAPLVVHHSVIVGVSGGDFGIRGFLAAYDVATGKQQWRFDTIPGPGELGHETWKNDAWRAGGGGTWATGSYDPTTDLLYWGVGNPSPDYNGDPRPGDNLFTDSVIALHARTGKLAWYFQFTPHDEHDWDSGQTPVLADLAIKGVPHKAILWANRNGFYYVLDRVTGEFLTGIPFVETTWATSLTSTGRPILTDAAKVTSIGRLTKPGMNGGINWQNPSFDQSRGTIFVPAVESSSIFTKATSEEMAGARTGQYFVGSGTTQTETGINEVVALDAATGQRKWLHITPAASLSHGNSTYSGLLSTASGLVFGASGDVLFALDSASGRELWRLPVGGTTKAPPISFTIDGRQVIAVAAGRTLFLLGL